MKTKTSILTALVAIASSATVMAQVYSLNVVGYVNVNVPTGFSMIANPLQTTNNTVASLLNVPDGTSIYKYDSTSGYIANNYFFGWLNPNMTIAPGEGFFINNQSGAPFTLTFVGEVLTGSLTNAIPSGYSIKSSMVPQAGRVDADLGFPVTDGDSIYRFDPVTQQYVAYNYFFGWNQQPSIAVGESFFAFKNTPVNWVRTFNPNTP